MSTGDPDDATRGFQCQTWSSPGRSADTASCLALGPCDPGREQLVTVITDLLADIDTLNPELRSRDEHTAEAGRILDERDYELFPVGIEGIEGIEDAEVTAARFGPAAYRLSVVVHGGHLIAVEPSVTAPGDFTALAFEPGVESVRAFLLS